MLLNLAKMSLFLLFQHIFGNHEQCASYFCYKSGQSNDILFSTFANGVLYEPYKQVLNRVATLSSSLLFDIENNAVECYNSVVNKFVGGKRISF